MKLEKWFKLGLIPIAIFAVCAATGSIPIVAVVLTANTLAIIGAGFLWSTCKRDTKEETLSRIISAASVTVLALAMLLAIIRQWHAINNL